MIQKTLGSKLTVALLVKTFYAFYVTRILSSVLLRCVLYIPTFWRHLLLLTSRCWCSRYSVS